MKIKEWLDGRFWRFLLVGVANTLVGNGLSFLLLNLTPVGYWGASAISYTLASVMSYFLNKHLTFRYPQTGWRPVVRFAVNIGVCWVIAYGIAQPLVARVLTATPVVQDNVAMAVGMVLFVALNYLGQRLVVFPSKTAE